MSVQKAMDALQDGAIFDPEHLLSPSGHHLVLQTIETLAQGKRYAKVLLLSEGESLGDYHVLWKRLQLNTETDLLLLYNQNRWEAKGWNLSKESISALLRAVKAEQKQSGVAPILASALNRLAKNSTPSIAPPTSSASSSFVLPSIAALVSMGALAWVLRRRSLLSDNAQRLYHDARSSAEQAFSDVMLAAEDLMTDEAAPLQLRASEQKRELDRLVASVGDRVLEMKRKTTLGKLQHIENELTVLRSTILQKEKRP